MNDFERSMCDEIGLSQLVIDKTGINISIVNVKSNTTLFKPGDTCKSFLILCKGAIRVEMTAKSGKEITLYRIRPSEGCVLTTSALLNNEYYYAQGIVECPVSAIALSNEDFYKVIQHSHTFTKFVLFNYAQRMSSIIRLIDRKTTRNIMFDVCEFLTLNINDKNIVNATHETIANDIGTAREVVGRKLRSLASQGAIELQRGKIFIKDTNQLQKIIKICD